MLNEGGASLTQKSMKPGSGGLVSMLKGEEASYEEPATESYLAGVEPGGTI